MIKLVSPQERTQLFEIRVLRRIFGPKKEVMTERRRRFIICAVHLILLEAVAFIGSD
jgi:hypothetical protein